MDCIQDFEAAEFKAWASYYALPNPIFVAIWTFGVLGNIVNVLVFSHRQLRGSAVNLLFWWLSFSDLFELILLMLLKFITGWCFYLDFSTLLYSGWNYSATKFHYIRGVGGVLIYLFLAFHTSAVLLNIIMAFLRCLAVRRPLRKLSICEYPSVKRIVISAYVISFVSSTPTLFVIALPFELYKFGVVRTKSSTFRNASDALATFSRILVFGGIVRVTLFAVRTVACVVLIVTVIRTRRKRRPFLDSARVANDDDGLVDSMKRITNLIIIIIVMFSITDMIMTLESVLTFGSVSIASKTLFSSVGNEVVRQSQKSIDILLSIKLPLACLQWLSILINCSHPVLCYLFYCTAYQKTLKALVADWCRFFRPSAEGENSGNHTYLTSVRT